MHYNYAEYSKIQNNHGMTTTKIEGTESTGNPSVGCSKVTAGCKNCYAETMAKRLQAMKTKGYENGFLSLKFCQTD